jgi:hypothetical protein
MHMSTNSVKAPLAQLETLATAIDGFASAEPNGNPFIEWHYIRHPNEEDTVAALIDVVASEEGRRRVFTVSQWLGPAAAYGDVRYSVRDLEGGPLIMWHQNPTTTADITYWDIKHGKPLPYDIEAAKRLASLVPSAQPTSDVEFYLREQTLLGRAVDAYIQLPQLLGEPAAYSY